MFEKFILCFYIQDVFQRIIFYSDMKLDDLFKKLRDKYGLSWNIAAFSSMERKYVNEIPINYNIFESTENYNIEDEIRSFVENNGDGK